MADVVEPSLVDIQTALSEVWEVLLANTVFISEIPAPTFHEEKRIQFLLDRFIESGLQNISSDEKNNGLAILPGSEGTKNILLVSHADTTFDPAYNHSVSVTQDVLKGPGVCDNSLGLAAIASLPILLAKLGIQLRHNLILMGSTRSLGRGNLEGLRFFLENNDLPIMAGVCVEGAHLGRLSYTSIGMMRGEITCCTDADHGGAIVHINNIIQKIQDIPAAKDSETSIVLGSIAGGTAFNTVATKTHLRFEIRSEDANAVKHIEESIEAITQEEDSCEGVQVHFERIARREPGGISRNHKLVSQASSIMEELGIEPIVAPSAGELSALIAAGIPAVTLGLTAGKDIHEEDESAEIQPIFKGLTQLIALLRSLDHDG